jgi:ElaB/YqjD/DUF883 family membrane-anchored ribosome-binding protein
MASQSFNQRPDATGGRRRTNTGGSRSGIEAGQNSPTANQSASTITSQVQGVLDQQVVKGAKLVSSVANSARRAADELETDTPQLAGLVRGMADRIQDYSRNLEDQSATEIYEAASDFTRRQPAVVFGLAALTGFFVLRTLKSASSSVPPEGRRATSLREEEFHGS